MPSDFAVASAGAVAAAASTAIMYPVDTVKTRLSLGVDSSSRAYAGILDVASRTWEIGGVSAFYRGLNRKLWISVLQKFLYFYFFSLFRRSLKGKVSVARHLLLGYCAAVISSVFVTPLEVLQTRLQLMDARNASSASSIADLFRKEGLDGLYRGFSTNLVLCANPAIEYTVVEKLRPNFRSTFLLGVVAKSVATVLTYPYIRAKTMQQAVCDKRGLGRIVAAILADGTALKGLDAQLGKVVLTSALMLVIKEKVEDRILSANKS